MTELLYIALFILASYSFMVNKGRAASLGKFNTLHSQPYYHGLYSSILIFLPAIILLIFWSSIQNIMTNLSIRDFFVDVSDPGLIKFYIDSVINYSNGVSSKIIEHDGFMPAVEKYSSLT